MSNESKNSIEKIRHSLSHVLAAGVLDMFSEAKLGIGPNIETGFYYDFDLPRTLIPEDLKLLEKKMNEIIKKDFPIEQYDEPKDKSKEFLMKANQTYKVELLDELEGDKVSFYAIRSRSRVGARDDSTGAINFVDMCKGPHVESTGKLKSAGYKLDKIAGAYFRGDEKNKMLQRIYGIAFETKDELKDFVAKREEAKKRDHRVLGQKLELFSFHEEAPGMAFWHPKGLVIFELLVSRWREIQNRYGYKEVKLPVMMDVNLWKQSGHYEHYKDGMFFTENAGKKMALRPMNCPGIVLYYKEKLHSYNDLPLKISEPGTVYRNEQSGELHGLMRVQSITQDDAHIFLTEEMIESEITEVIKIMDEIYKPFDMKREIFLSTRPDDAMGDKKVWDKAEAALKSALKANNIEYSINEKDGAFYGPKIDIQIKDSLGRTWQTGTIQLDFFMPERFELEYVAKDGSKKRPVMIHRALMGSLERFIGVLTEHYGGAFPIWLAPIQVMVLPISDKHIEYAKEVASELGESNVRVEVDERSESIGKKIRESEIQKIPYMLVVGDKEESADKVAVRMYGKGDKGQMSLKEMVKLING